MIEEVTLVTTLNRSGDVPIICGCVATSVQIFALENGHWIYECMKCCATQSEDFRMREVR